MEESLHDRKDSRIWDLVLLNPQTEESLLKTMCSRYKKNQIYTYIGNELISINPYENLDIYDRKFAVTYLQVAPFQLPPHLFSIIATAYRRLFDGCEDQCIVMIGESGSGKTYGFRKILDFLHFTTLESNACASSVQNLIVRADTIIEAFGHAGTTFNDNSSRFGKFLEMELDFKGDPLSACYTCYLLDKNRVSSQPFGERNFHIFYQLLNGAEACLLKTLKLHRNALTYTILKQWSSDARVEEDKQNFIRTKKSMEALGFGHEMLSNVFKIVATILKLGNIIFVSVTNIDGTEGCAISNELEMYEICELLGIEVATFRTVATCRSVYTLQSDRSSSVSEEMLAEEATRLRDIVCKSLYNRLFTWLIKTINGKIKMEPRDGRKRICLSDMFGLEDFENNGVHQFIVNYCNEKFFLNVSEANMKAEQEEYVREGLEWLSVDYLNINTSLKNNNEEILEELLLALDHLNDTEKGATIKERLLHKLRRLNSVLKWETDGANLSPNECSSKKQSHRFKVRHYFGEVTYDVSHFVEKGGDVVTRDVSIMMFDARNSLLKILFPEGSVEVSSLKKRPSSLSKQIQIALAGILRNLSNKKLYYVRCFKPNDLKGSRIFETNLVLRQMRIQRIMATVRLRRDGFSFSLPHAQFLNRYKMLSLLTWPSPRLPTIESIQYLLREIPIPSAEFAYGATKIFVRSPRSVYELEEFRRQRLDDVAVIIQSVWKKFYYRRRFLRSKRAQITISRAWRSHKKRKDSSRMECKRQIDWAVEIIQRHYIQWKRYHFLKRLIRQLTPRTMSPLNQDWPSCDTRLADTSLILRKLHHKWRCKRYRSQFNQTSRNKMREKVTASFLFKNRKCCYSGSVSQPFVGDYVRLRQNNHWKKICVYGNDQYVVFADMINKITRSTGKYIPMLMVMSTSSMMLMDQRTLDIKYRIPATEIYRISLSPFEDSIAVVHINSNEVSSSNSDVSQCFSASSNVKPNSGCFFFTDYYEKGDIIFQTSHIIEVVTKLFLVVQNATGKPPDVNISTWFNAYFNQQIVTVSFYYVTPCAVDFQSDSEPFKIFRKGNKMEVAIVQN